MPPASRLTRRRQLLEAAYRNYGRFFSRTYLFAAHRLLFNLSLRGLGIQNHHSPQLSGEAAFLKKVVSRLQRPVVVDVGANVGAYADAVKAAVPSARLVAVEPNPTSYAVLARRAEAAGYEAFNLACSSSPGTASLFDRAGAAGSVHASMYSGVIEELHRASTHRVQVTTQTLDGLAAEVALDRIDLLKIDTEGHEYEVLKGANGLLAAERIGIVHFEFNEMNVFSRTFCKDFVDLLAGFSLFRMLPDGLVPLGAYSPAYYELFAYQNLVAVRADLLPGLGLGRGRR